MLEANDWPDDLDALIAAPLHHTLLFENETARVLDTRVQAGQAVPLHTHRWPGVLYILSWSDFVRRDANGSIVLDSRSVGKVAEERARWSASLPPHTLENVGESELRVITFEMKSAN